MPRLLLFDIDGTLIDSNGAGGAAILDAAEEHFGIRRDDCRPAARRRHRSRDRDGRVRPHEP
jgi:beta-phosphoglucomutase-like phosphatase (HAD superfamily)